MTCAACARRIEKVVGKMEGVNLASVNFATEKAIIAYDPKKTDASKIKETIEKVGYKALETSGEVAQNEKGGQKHKELHTLRIKFILAVFFGIPLLYIAMAPMITMIKLPFPVGISPGQHPLAYGLAQLILVIPIIGVGYRFYTVGFRSFFRSVPIWIH